MRLRFLFVLSFICLVLLVPVATAAAPTFKVIAPGDSVAKGGQPTFKVRLSNRPKGESAVFVTVSRSRATKNGVLTNPVYLEKMAAAGNTYTASPAKFTYGTYWLNSPGEYWWQVYLVKCKAGSTNCYTPITPRKLVVRG